MDKVYVLVNGGEYFDVIAAFDNENDALEAAYNEARNQCEWEDFSEDPEPADHKEWLDGFNSSGYPSDPKYIILTVDHHRNYKDANS